MKNNVLAACVMVLFIILPSFGVVESHEPTHRVYESGFTESYTNPRDWRVSLGSWNTGNGVLYGKGRSGIWNGAYFGGRTYSKLDYKVRMRRMGCGSCKSGILVRANNLGQYASGYWANGFWLTYTNNGFYSVWKTVNNREYVLRSGYSSSIKTGWNEVRIVASGYNYKMYINNRLLESLTDYSFTSGSVGMQLYGGWSWTGDDYLMADWATLTTR